MTEAWRISLRLEGPFGTPLSGQWFVRHALQSLDSRDASLGVSAGARNWSINVGGNITVFGR